MKEWLEKFRDMMNGMIDEKIAKIDKEDGSGSGAGDGERLADDDDENDNGDNTMDDKRNAAEIRACKSEFHSYVKAGVAVASDWDEFNNLAIVRGIDAAVASFDKRTAAYGPPGGANINGTDLGASDSGNDEGESYTPEQIEKAIDARIKAGGLRQADKAMYMKKVEANKNDQAALRTAFKPMMDMFKKSA